MAPETLVTERVSNLLDGIQVDLLVIDEAHCISEWGHDFRPEYREIINVRKQLAGVTCLALTATATHRVRADIKKSLGFDDHNEFISSFDRKNLVIEIVPKTNALQQAMDMINQFPGRSGIIYCFSRKQVDELAAQLTHRHISALPYHAGLDDGTRRRNQEAFIRDDVNIIVATVAFGMGINKPDVRFVLHYDLPKSLEGYYQEIGRAGRDGQTSVCRLLFSYGDKNKIQYILRQKVGKERKAAEEQFEALLRYVEVSGCRRKPLLAYFGETYSASSCDMCDWCLASQEKMVDITIPAQKFLSCVKRTGEIFGAFHIIDVLMGVPSEKVLSHNHQTISTFGIGKDWSKQQWLQLADQLGTMQLIEKSGQFNSLKLTDAAADMLRTRQSISAIQPRLQPSLLDHKQPLGRQATLPGSKPVTRRERMPETDTHLYDVLRKLRKEIADREGIPPYAIFADRTLVEMAAYHPHSLPALKQMYGVGSVKGERFGEIFMQTIIKFCRANNLKEVLKKGPTASVQPHIASSKKPRFVDATEDFIAGTSLEEIMSKYAVQAQTVFGYFVKYIKAGHNIPDPARFLTFSKISPTLRKQVLQAYQELGAEYLQPVFARMNEKVDFNELRILQVYFLCQHQQKVKSGG
jgi:ATP-dependent DNA helicase RecQ